MERTVNEIFIDGHALLQCVAVDEYCHCHECYYDTPTPGCNCNRLVAGNCHAVFRRDHRKVIFRDLRGVE